MPVYEFRCLDCHKDYERVARYDPSGTYSEIACPSCESKKKKKKVSMPVVMGTDSRNSLFENRAGKNMEKAKDLRRKAEAASHMGADPYTASSWDDTQSYDTGVHDQEVEGGWL